MTAPALDVLLIALVALPFAAALAIVALPRGRHLCAAGASATLFLAAVALAGHVTTHGVHLVAFDWAPTLGVALALRADGLSILFAMLVTGIGALVFVYADAYLAPSQARERAAPILLLFQGAMLGAVLADDLVLLFVFWELTSLTSFLLVGYDHESASARRAALQGLLVTVAGGLAMLAGIVLIGSAAGTLRVGEAIVAPALRESGLLAAAVIVLLSLGAFAKSAQTPLHFWLPNAMAAPTPVSAYLHSATMVKLGVYLLARFDPLFGSTGIWQALLIGTGTATMLVAAVLAMRESDLKRVLACSTVVALGTLIMLVGLDHAAAATAFALVLLMHALYKAALFFVAGILDHETGTRDARRLGGLARRMPLTAAAAALAAASMAGLPPFLGFLAKELLYAVQLDVEFGGLLVASAVLVNGAMIGVAGLVALRPFFGSSDGDALAARDPGHAMLVAPLIAGALGCAFGILPFLVEPLLDATARAIDPVAASSTLALWHGLAPELALSLATLAIGVLVYLSWPRTQPVLAEVDAIDRFGAERGYEGLLARLLEAAKLQTAAIQAGSLRRYVAFSVLAVSLATLATLVLGGGVALPAVVADPLAWTVAALLVVAALVTALASDHALAALMAAGVAGFGAAVLFLFAGAPDLAFTQVAVEALAIVLVLAIFARLPLRRPDPRPPRERRRDAAIALLFGGTISALLLAVLAAPMDGALADWFRANSLPEAKGRNVVNVIIVDFRALDTMGEIAVLAFAALGAIALVRGGRRRFA